MYFNGNNLILILKTFKVIYFGKSTNRTPRDDMGTGTPGDVRLSFPKQPRAPAPRFPFPHFTFIFHLCVELLDLS